MRRAFAQGRTHRPPPAHARARLAELAEHYAGVAEQMFARPTGSSPIRQVPLAPRAGADSLVDLTFPSQYRPTYAPYREQYGGYGHNHTAYARLYRGASPNRPAIICLHGWGGGTSSWLEERAFCVPYLIRLGFDVALLELPFHGRRVAEGGPRSGALFLTNHLVRTNEAFGQAVWDVRVLADHLRQTGAPALGLFGISLGGYVTGLTVGLEPTVDFAATLIPAVVMSELMWMHGEGSTSRRRAERAGISRELLDQVFAVHSPLARAPLVGRDRLFIAAGRGDAITPPSQAEALWRHWGRPELTWFAGGHLVQATRADAFRALGRFLRALPWGLSPAIDTL